MKRMVFRVLLTTAVGVLVAGSASAQQAVTLTITPTRGPVGTVINFTVTGCPAVALAARTDEYSCCTATSVEALT